MKICIITDTHWGIRNDHPAFLDNSKLFLDNLFYPYLSSNGIDTVVHLGDIVDRRKYINYYTAKRLREDFLEPLRKNGIRMDIIAGNHDVYFKNTNNVNALKELLRGYDNITVFDNEAVTVTYDNLKVFLIPWICDENRASTMKSMEETNAQIAFGHLEIAGFEMYKGSMVSHGEERTTFDKFDMVLSGHFHHRSSDGHIYYLGSHGEFTWADYDDPRGFHVFDTDTRELTFIENPYKIFKKVWYDDSKVWETDADNDSSPLAIDFTVFKDSIVKVIVQAKTNNYMFEKFIEKIEYHNPVEVVVVEDNLNLNLQEDSSIVEKAEDTIDIFRGYISTMDSKSVNKEKLESKILELYVKAKAME